MSYKERLTTYGRSPRGAEGKLTFKWLLSPLIDRSRIFCVILFNFHSHGKPGNKNGILKIIISGLK